MNVKRIVLVAVLTLMANGLSAMNVSRTTNDYVLEKEPKQFLGVTTIELRRKSDDAMVRLSYHPQTPLRAYEGYIIPKVQKGSLPGSPANQLIDSQDAEALYQEFTRKRK